MKNELSTIEKLIERENRAAEERAVDRQEVEFLNTGPKEQVNFRLYRNYGFMLDQLAAKYDHSRASMAASLVMAALTEAWEAAGMASLYEEGPMQAELFAYIRDEDE